MRFLTGLAIGGAVGYVMGSKAGREQYDRLVEMAADVLSDETIASVKATLGLSEVDSDDPTDPAAD